MTGVLHARRKRSVTPPNSRSKVIDTPMATFSPAKAVLVAVATNVAVASRKSDFFIVVSFPVLFCSMRGYELVLICKQRDRSPRMEENDIAVF